MRRNFERNSWRRSLRHCENLRSKFEAIHRALAALVILSAAKNPQIHALKKREKSPLPCGGGLGVGNCDSNSQNPKINLKFKGRIHKIALKFARTLNKIHKTLFFKHF